MKQTISLACSVAALVIATLGSTPLGEAAQVVAAQVVPRNSVGTPQLKRNAVNARKLAPNSVRTAHVLDGSLLAADLSPARSRKDRRETRARRATGVSLGRPRGSWPWTLQLPRRRLSRISFSS